LTARRSRLMQPRPGRTVDNATEENTVIVDSVALAVAVAAVDVDSVEDAEADLEVDVALVEVASVVADVAAITAIRKATSPVNAQRVMSGVVVTTTKKQHWGKFP